MEDVQKNTLCQYSSSSWYSCERNHAIIGNNHANSSENHAISNSNRANPTENHANETNVIKIPLAFLRQGAA